MKKFAFRDETLSFCERGKEGGREREREREREKEIAKIR